MVDRLLRIGTVILAMWAWLASTAEITIVAKGKRDNDKQLVQTPNDNARLTLEVSPNAALAGTYVRARIRVPPDVENRMLRLSVESSNYFRSSDVTLNGADAPITHIVPLRALPAGSYAVVATVYGVDGERARSLQKLELRSPHERN
jgi:hypothetical protein